jgi:hypothetical protein
VEGEVVSAGRYVRDHLRSEQRVAGPSVLVEYSSTGFVPPGWIGRVDATGQIVLQARSGRHQDRNPAPVTCARNREPETDPYWGLDGLTLMRVGPAL